MREIIYELGLDLRLVRCPGKIRLLRSRLHFRISGYLTPGTYGTPAIIRSFSDMWGGGGDSFGVPKRTPGMAVT